MKETVITFDTAQLIKEKGFNEPCFNFYENGELMDGKKYGILSVRNSGFLEGYKWVRHSAPTQSVLQKWFREEKKIRIFVTQGVSGHFNFEIYKPPAVPNQIGRWDRVGNISSFNSYEEALEEGFKKALTLI